MFKSILKCLCQAGVVLAIAPPLSAENPKSIGPLGAEAFDRLTVGKTFIFGRLGQQYGAEEYFENRRVRWSFLDGQCVEGNWYPQDNQICFTYEHRNDAQCWTVFENRGRITVVPEGAALGSDRALVELKQGDEPLYCMGPDVGA